MRCSKTIHFWIIFYWNFLRFGLRKVERKMVVFWIFIEQPDFVKVIVFLKENGFVVSFQNWIKFRCKFFFENYIGKNGSKIEFGFPKPSKLFQKAAQNEACCATLWKPRAIRRTATGLATLGLRQLFGVWLGLLYLIYRIYLSIDLPLVTLIIKVRSATWHAPRISLLIGQGNQQTSSRGIKIHENQAPRVSKSIPKAA